MRALLILIAVLTLGSAAQAQEFYAGGGLGFTQIEDEEAGVGFDDTAIGWRIFGGYKFSPNFALELGYVDSGTAEDTLQGVFGGTNLEVDFTAWTVTGLGILPLNESWDLFGKLGYFDGEFEASSLGLSAADDESGFTLGAGARFKLSENLAIRGDFDWYDTEADTLWSIGVGVQFNFGM